MADNIFNIVTKGNEKFADSTVLFIFPLNSRLIYRGICFSRKKQLLALQ